MSSAEIRVEINKYLDQVKDESFLRVVHSMLDTYIHQIEENPIVGYDIEGNPIHASEARKEYAARLDAMKKGQHTTIEDLKKEAEQW